ncbi:MAG: peptidoglycan-binding protein [Prochlorotrichaceae cyanobacterium]|jgi:peptidoglycan hydrolase-like protein with peptidoglycan-binding domain
MPCSVVGSTVGLISVTSLLWSTLGVLAQTPPVNLPEITPAPTTTPVDRPQLAVGDQGPLVQQLQFYLQELGYLSEPPNGIFGESTAAAVRTLQERRGLTIDGVMTTATWDVLITDYQIKAFDLSSIQESQVDLPAPTPSPTASSVALSPPSTPEPQIAPADLKELSLPPDRPDSIAVTLPAQAATPPAAVAQTLDKTSSEPKADFPFLVFRAFLGISLLGLGSAFLLKLLRILRQGSPPSSAPAENAEANPSVVARQTLEIVPNAQPPEDGSFSTEGITAITYPIKDRSSLITPELATPEFARMSHRDKVEELISQLTSDQVALRRQAVWELGQHADSRAMKPLMELFPVADSQEQSLILAAISEIGAKTFKPMKQALALSLDSPNPEVRKNAIRDLQRLHEMVSQASKLIQYALENPDPEVQETAQWALEQIERLNRANTPRQLK